MTGIWIGIAAAFALFLFWFWRTGAGRETTTREGDGPSGSRAPQDDELHGPDSKGARPEDFVSTMGTVVLLHDNAWDACAVDGVKEDWKRFGGSGVRGFAGVGGGRHQVVTTTAAGDAVHDFVLYPGEIYVTRLNAATATWEAISVEDEAADRRRARGGSMGSMADALVSYRTTFGIARVMAGGAVKAPEVAVDAACARLDGLLRRALADQPAETLVKEAYEIGRALIGVPMTRDQLAAVIGPIGKLATERAIATQYKRGALLLSLGLAVLPDDPYLLEQLAAMLSGSGLPQDALICLDKVLRRDLALDADALVRARATKAEVLCKLGRTDEARALVNELYQARPDDENVTRARRIVNDTFAN